MTWALLIWSAIHIIWIVAGLASVEECPYQTVQECEFYDAGTAIGAGIGVGLVLAIWFAGFIVLSIIWFMTKPRGE